MTSFEKRFVRNLDSRRKNDVNIRLIIFLSFRKPYLSFRLINSLSFRAKQGTVILSPALGGTKDLKIPRLPPRNDITTQPPGMAISAVAAGDS